MNPSKFYIFYAILTSLMIFLDLYFFLSWRKFVLKRNWNKLIYRIPSIISVFMVIAFFWLTTKRMNSIEPDAFLSVIYAIVSVWFLPKIGVVPLLIFKDLTLFIKNVLFKFSKNKTAQTQSSNSLANKENSLDRSAELANSSRRRMIQNTGWALAAAPFIITAKGAFDTLYDFKVHNHELFLTNLPKSLDGIKIAQISDIHAGSFTSYKPFQEAVRMTLEQKADILTLTGDFVNFNPEELKHIYKDLGTLDAKLGVFACLGNHDHYMKVESTEEMKKWLRNLGFNLLDNESKRLIINGSPLNFSGVDNYGMNQFFGDFEKAISPVPEGETNILLCHDPRNWDMFINKGKKPVDLMLSGHTHGGQVSLEIAGIDLSVARIAYKQWAGLYKEGEQYLYVNRGLGTTGPPIRIGINPEITVFTLRSQVS